MAPTSRMKKHESTLHYLASCPMRNRKYIVKGATDEVIRAISDCAYNIIKGKVALNPRNIKKIKPLINDLRQLATHTVTLARKKKILGSQHGGSILGVLWSILKPLLFS